MEEVDKEKIQEKIESQSHHIAQRLYEAYHRDDVRKPFSMHLENKALTSVFANVYIYSIQFEMFTHNLIL